MFPIWILITIICGFKISRQYQNLHIPGIILPVFNSTLAHHDLWLACHIHPRNRSNYHLKTSRFIIFIFFNIGDIVPHYLNRTIMLNTQKQGRRGGGQLTWPECGKGFAFLAGGDAIQYNILQLFLDVFHWLAGINYLQSITNTSSNTGLGFGRKRDNKLQKQTSTKQKANWARVGHIEQLDRNQKTTKL